MNDVKYILNSCMSILGTIRIDYNSPIGPRTKNLIFEINRLIPLLEKEQPYMANLLKVSLMNLPLNGCLINAYAFGEICTAVKILNNVYNSEKSNNSLVSSIITQHQNRKKIFISHSSKDKPIVEKFVDHILMLGIGLSAEDIFCTSIEDMAIKNGEDIRNHIHTNIQDVDFSILLISKNYKNSEICINEMGAVWAYNNNVRLYLLPNVNFYEIGWLCDTRKADNLFDSIVLDTLKMELSKFYSLCRSAALLPLSPLRTVRATFTAYSSDNSKFNSHKIKSAHSPLLRVVVVPIKLFIHARWRQQFCLRLLK